MNIGYVVHKEKNNEEGFSLVIQMLQQNGGLPKIVTQNNLEHAVFATYQDAKSFTFDWRDANSEIVSIGVFTSSGSFELEE